MIEKLHSFGAKAVAVTLGGQGAIVSINEVHKVNSIEVDMIDSTGAGDAFIGALLSQIAELDNCKSILNDEELLIEFTKKANKVGALTTTKLGALDSIPTWNEVI